MSSIELQELIGKEKLIKTVDEQSKRIKKELDKLRKEEINTYWITKDYMKIQ